MYLPASPAIHASGAPAAPPPPMPLPEPRRGRLPAAILPGHAVDAPLPLAARAEARSAARRLLPEGPYSCQRLH